MQNSILDRLHDPAVRDLAWVIGARGLLDSSTPAYRGQVVEDEWCSEQLVSCAAWLEALDSSPQPLHQFIAERPTRRLGHYFETLIAYWLAHIPGTQIIATNLQVQNAFRTEGEYDFLFSNSDAKIVHWEAAVKFYLQQEPLAEQRAFIGPGTRDRLDLKLSRVFQHQLLLGDTPAGRLSLPMGVRLDKAQAFIKGYLFYHPTASGETAIPGISSLHLKGWWIRHTLEALPQSSTDSRWAILPRMRWLAPALLPADAEVLTDIAVNLLLDEHFRLSSDAQLLFEMVRSNAGTWIEVSRGFVVCRQWPALETKYN